MAVFSYYGKELGALGRGNFPEGFLKSPAFRLLCLTGLALIPSVSLAFFLKPVIEKTLTSLLWTGAGFLLTGLFLILTCLPLRKKHKEDISKSPTDFIRQSSQKIRVLPAFLVGLVQVLAFFPGMSRAGWTVGMALFLGVPKKQAVFFSFLLAIPSILGAMLFELLSLPDRTPPPVSFISLTLAFLGSWLFGFLALKILVRSLEKLSFPCFALYLCPLGVYLLLTEGTQVFSP